MFQYNGCYRMRTLSQLLSTNERDTLKNGDSDLINIVQYHYVPLVWQSFYKYKYLWGVRRGGGKGPEFKSLGESFTHINLD